MASDEAHAWARSLRLGNPYAKSVLQALTLYVNDEATCFVSVGQLGEDTDLSEDTVRRRLRFLEDIGAIVRFPRWRDELGRANSDGRGKRTTDDIKLLVDADMDEIEAKARGDGVAEGAIPPDGSSPRQQQGLSEEVRGRLGVGQPSQSGGGLISEPEPEDFPKPPLGVVSAALGDQETEREKEPEQFQEFWLAYPGYRVMDRSRTLAVFRALSESEQGLARRAVAHLASDLAKLKRRPKDAYKWLRDKGFEQYTVSAPPSEGVWITEGSDEDRGLRLARDLVQMPQRFVRTSQGKRGYFHKVPVGLDLVAMLACEHDNRLHWLSFARGSPQFAAWQARLTDWTGRPLPTTPGPEGDVIRVPWQWPPAKDGRIYDDGDNAQGAA